jgi:acetyl-CoA acetyltransferase
LAGLAGKTAIVGVSQTQIGRVPGKSAMELNAEAALAALADAGMRPDDVDGLLVFGARADDHVRYQALVAEHLGLPAKRFTDVTKTGGASSAGAVRMSAAMVASGQCENVLTVFGDNVGSGVQHEEMLRKYVDHHHPEFEVPYGPLIISLYALVACRTFHEFGWNREMLAAAAVAERAFAVMNPDAQFRTPITIEDVLRSRPITTPLHLLDCAPISDGAAAVIVTRSETAAEGLKPPVYIRGASGRFSNYYIHSLPDYTNYLLSLARASSDEAFAMSGLDRRDIDAIFVGDPTSICIPFNLVGTGFFEIGEVEKALMAGETGPGGRYPTNTHGGNLSCAHPGTPGQMLHVVEAVRQLRHECGERQVPGAAHAYVHGQAGVFTSHSAVVLSNEPSTDN